MYDFNPFPTFEIAIAIANENAKARRTPYKVQKCTCINQTKTHYMVTPGRMQSYFDSNNRRTFRENYEDYNL